VSVLLFVGEVVVSDGVGVMTDDVEVVTDDVGVKTDGVEAGVGRLHKQAKRMKLNIRSSIGCRNRLFFQITRTSSGILPKNKRL
jgi:hypothetical protein